MEVEVETHGAAKTEQVDTVHDRDTWRVNCDGRIRDVRGQWTLPVERERQGKVIVRDEDRPWSQCQWRDTQNQ